MANETCWTLLHSVRLGRRTARAEFAERYLPVIRNYLDARWRRSRMSAEIDDAQQEVFLRCFADASPLDRLDSVRGGFRGFLFGVTRNVAREFEKRRGQRAAREENELDGLEEPRKRPSQVFDQQYALQLLRECRIRFRAQSAGDPEAARRYRVLELRFDEGLPIRTIAEQLGAAPPKVHKDYAQARREYRQLLLAVVADHNPGKTRAELDQAATRLIELVR